MRYSHFFQHAIGAAAMCVAFQSGAITVWPSDQKTTCYTYGGPIDNYCGEDGLGPSLTEHYGGREQRAAVEFPLEGIAGLAVATLGLTANNRSTDAAWLQAVPVIEFRGYQGDGQIALTDFSAGVLLFSSSFLDDGAYTFDVTSFIAEALAQGWTHVGFSLRNVVWDSYVGFYPATTGYREGAPGGNYLSMLAEATPRQLPVPMPPPPIPEPSSYALMVLGLIGIGFAARRHARS